MGLCCLCVLVRLRAVLVSRVGVGHRLHVLAEFMIMGGLKMMVGGGVVMSGGQLMMFGGRMFRLRHGADPLTRT